MGTKEPQVCDVTEDRFRTVLTFLRMAGVPINMKHVSTLHSIYNALLAINAYALYLAFYMDIIIHNDDLKNFMKTFRIVNSSTVIHWLHLTLRYIIYCISLYCYTLHTSTNQKVFQWLRRIIIHKNDSQYQSAGPNMLLQVNVQAIYW
jgi:hypothetical protein